MRLPEGASLNRTAELVAQVEDIIRPIPGVQGVLSVVGLNFIDYVVSSNSAFFVIRLKPYEQRTAPRAAGRRDPRQPAPASSPPSRAPSSSPSTCRRSSGSAAPAASSTCSQALQGQSPTDLAAVTRALIVAANQQPELAGVFTHLRRRHAADLSRHRPRQGAGAGRQGERHLQRAAVDAGRLLRQRLQPVRPHLAGQHPGGRPLSRRHRGHLPRLCPQRSGTMVPIRALAQAQARAGAAGRHPLQRLPGGRSSTARPSPASVPGQALAAMERISATTLPPGYGFEWTGTALQEKAASGQTGIVLGLAVLFAYLFLVALYESWNIPLPVLLSVSVGVLGAIAAVALAGARLRRLCPDRPRRAGGARRQERHPDRRVRRRAAARRQGDPRRRRSRARGCASAR